MNSKIKWKNIETSDKSKLTLIQDMHYDALILYRVEQWLQGEMKSNQKVVDTQDKSILFDIDFLHIGRHECAESLSEQISTWRKELRGLE